jgi:hypothetical protein
MHRNGFVTLHYVTFIEPFDVLSTEALSFDDENFTSNYNIFESQNNDLVLCFKEHFFDVVALHKNNNEDQFEELPHKVLEVFSNM